MTHTSLSLASPSPRPSTSTTPDTEFIESVPLKLSDQDSSVEQSPVVESSKTDIVPNVTLNRRNKVQKNKRAHVNIKKSSKNNCERVESSGQIKGTITSMFDIMKRKLSPEKEADTVNDNQKIQHSKINES